MCGRNIKFKFVLWDYCYLRQQNCCFSTGFFHWAQRVDGALASDLIRGMIVSIGSMQCESEYREKPATYLLCWGAWTYGYQPELRNIVCSISLLCLWNSLYTISLVFLHHSFYLKEPVKMVSLGIKLGVGRGETALLFLRWTCQHRLAKLFKTVMQEPKKIMHCDVVPIRKMACIFHVEWKQNENILWLEVAKRKTPDYHFDWSRD